MSRVIVLGGGAMGLAAAYHATRLGHQVTVLEADQIAGGMAAHFDLAGLDIERFYHFVCRTDQPTFDLLAEIGLPDQIDWRPTSMGYFYEGALYPWGDPWSLLTFPRLGFIAKIRYGLHAFLAMRRKNWRDLDGIRAVDWLRAWVGREAYEKVWHKLFSLKFHEFSGHVSAAWIWARIHRAGRSRRNMFQEELGVIRGGSQTLIARLVEKIHAGGGEVRLGASATQVLIKDGRVEGVMVGNERLSCDQLISTIPLPLIPDLIPDLPVAEATAYRAIQNIGVVCVVHKMRRRLTSHFWVNINDDRIDIPGLIEFSNLRDFGADHALYIPYYMPVDHPHFQQPDRWFVDRTISFLQMIDPHFTPDDVTASKVGRLRYAQPVCPPGFAHAMPPVQSAVQGLQIADTSTYYPEDRGIAESVRLGKAMAEALQ